MFHPTELFIALRYSRSKLKGGFTTFINRVSRFGIFLGVAALVVVTSVMNGFEADLKSRILGVVPHIVIESAEHKSLKDWSDYQHSLSWPDEVEAALPYVQSEGLLQSPTSLMPVQLQGVFPESLKAADLSEKIIPTELLLKLRPGQYSIILGRALVRQLDIRLGDKVRVLASEGQRYTPMGLMPAQRQFTYIGTFEAGSNVDEQVVFLHAEDAANLFAYPAGHVTGIRLYLKDPYRSFAVQKKVEAQIEALYGQPLPLKVEEWHQQYGQLFNAVQMEKKLMALMLSLIIFLAAFNAISALTLLIQDKKSDTAILQTIGMQRRQIYCIFLLQGAYMGVVGGGLGVFVGCLLTYFINPILALMGINFLGDAHLLPFLFDWKQISWVFFFSLMLSLLATLYPAWQAIQISPAEVLRDE